MKILNDLLVTVDFLKEQAQEWDGNLGRCHEFVIAIAKTAMLYKDFHNRRFSEH